MRGGEQCRLSLPRIGFSLQARGGFVDRRFRLRRALRTG